MNYPFYPGEGIKSPDRPVELPHSRQSAQTRPEGYLPDKGLIDAVNVALLLGQPLLLTGEPGTGKTQLAYHLAHRLGLQAPLKFETKSNSSARDLFYVYNALGRFHATQTKEGSQLSKDYLRYNALGLAIVLANEKSAVEAWLPAGFSADLKKIFGDGFKLTGPVRSVVLIDEIDKAPRDFPNDILNEVENMYFRIPELDNAVIGADAARQPVLVMTSNSEKHLPDAFLRRCVYYHLPFPDEARLKSIVSARLGEFAGHSSTFLKDALDLFHTLREPSAGLRKKPATAELLNWLTILREMFKNVENPIAERPDELIRTLSPLVKTQEDKQTAQRIVQNFHTGKN
ncbi:MAG: MoxR family ATPase [Gammaproteobacteria bacterium]|nr:MoxR family ATPase [Gammaproteobacteria bacterium]